jgi:hypothetical protein
VPAFFVSILSCFTKIISGKKNLKQKNALKKSYHYHQAGPARVRWPSVCAMPAHDAQHTLDAHGVHPI